MANAVYIISSDESDSEVDKINARRALKERAKIRSCTKDSESDQEDAMDVVTSTVTINKDSSKNSPHNAKKKANVAILKKTKKQKLTEEKAAKKSVNDMNKIYKPGECMKYMNVEGHPSLWSRWYMSDVPHELSASGAHIVQANELCDPSLIMWSRTLSRSLQADEGQVRLTPSQECCDRALYVATGEELSELVSSHSLATHLAQIQQICGCKLTLLVFQVADNFKSKGRKTSNSNRSAITEIYDELAITDLLVSAGCDTLVAKTSNELALTIVQFTKAIAEAPFKKAKRACDEQADFYMRGDNKKCVAVDKDGVGVSRLWQQMIAILPQSSLETSRALCAHYKAPLPLFNALLLPDTKDKIADIGVCRATVAGAKARRIGPEFARKLHTLFTATSGDVVIE